MSPLRFVTWNIHGGRDLAAVGAGLAGLTADVIALQEVDAGWGERSDWRDVPSELAHRLGMRVAYGPALELDHGRRKRRYGVALLTRWPIANTRLMPIGPSGDWDPEDHETEPRAALIAEILAPTGRLRAVSAHLSPRMIAPDRLESSERTRRQAADLTRLLHESDLPTLLGVDLNAEAGSPEWEAISEGGRYRYLPTTNLPTWPTSDYRWREVRIPAQPGRAIDWIFADRALQSDGALVIELAGSDHRAVVADFLPDGSPDTPHSR